MHHSSTTDASEQDRSNPLRLCSAPRPPAAITFLLLSLSLSCFYYNSTNRHHDVASVIPLLTAEFGNKDTSIEMKKTPFFRNLVAADCGFMCGKK